MLGTVPETPAERAPRPDPVLSAGRIVTALLVAGPFLGFACLLPFISGHLLNVSDVVIAVVLYVFTGFGISVGFHRLLTHRSFKAKQSPQDRVRRGRFHGPRGVGDQLGGHPSPASHVRGPARRPPFSAPLRTRCRRDAEGVPLGTYRLVVRHGPHRHQAIRSGPPSGPGLRRDRSAVPAAGRGFPCCSRSSSGGRCSEPCSVRSSALLWAGLVRMAVLHHVTWSINSVCHLWGRQAVRNSRPQHQRRGSLPRFPSGRAGTTSTTPRHPRPAMACCPTSTTSRLD